ncbi:hypothetical protein M8C21_002570, partial [Ambrosia artemisiifolia]
AKKLLTISKVRKYDCASTHQQFVKFVSREYPPFHWDDHYWSQKTFASWFRSSVEKLQVVVFASRFPALDEKLQTVPKEHYLSQVVFASRFPAAVGKLQVVFASRFPSFVEKPHVVFASRFPSFVQKLKVVPK